MSSFLFPVERLVVDVLVRQVELNRQVGDGTFLGAEWLPSVRGDIASQLLYLDQAVERNVDGGIHHICYEVVDIIASRDQLIKEGARVLGDGQPKIGAHGKPVLFFHPKDFSGALVEIEQA